ncbi:MAG: translation initiation factor IF-2 [Kofleriaceae bacterium]|nr:translation initiation factor IF-2 [Kofleriaceae bacterium]
MTTGAKMRVYEIAREVGIPNKDLLAKIRSLGLEVNNHMSSLDADDVVRIKRSLEKEKSGGDKPAEAARAPSSATVLRRRTAKADDGDDGKTAAPPVASSTPAAAPTTVVRRRSADAAEAPAAATPTVEARPPAVEARPSVAEPSPRTPEPRAPEPLVAASPEPAPARPVVPAPAPAPAPADEAPAPQVAAPVAPAEPPVRPVRPPAPIEPAAPAATPSVVEPTPSPVAVTPPVRPRSSVIVAGPQMVTRTGAGATTGTRVAATLPDAEPPPSSQLPPRASADTRPREVEKLVTQSETAYTETARSRFEAELERARARTQTRDDLPPSAPAPAPAPSEVEAAAAAAAAAAPARDGRPAVGTIISLPPRIKITERGPMGRPIAPPPGPAGQIRGRFADQQRRPSGGKGGPPGRDLFGKKKLPLGKKGKQTQLTTPAEHKRVIRIEDTIIVADLARSMGVKAPEVLKKLWGMGMAGVNINASIDFETAQILASEFGYEVQNVAFKEEDIFTEAPDDPSAMTPRAPVVTVMGHVDHGKTSLLDQIRKARVAAGEAGGITQHVAAYKVKVPGHGEVVFLDTPGHEAFTEMRARGAQATDIVILVVAANDGVMPQTLEALAHAKDAKVAIIVAVNKCDMVEAQPERIRQQLADHGLIPEEWGGETMYVNVSALKGENIDKLLEAIALTAEMLELKANADKLGGGVVIEARLDRARGPMATVLVQEGIIRVGDTVVAGRHLGKVRAMLDDRGNSLKEAGPSTPVEVLGLDGVPEAGDAVNVAEDEKAAKTVVEHRRQQWRKRELASTAKVSLENLMERINESGDTKELKIVLKADVQGSAEALKAALIKQATEKVKVTVIGAAVGGITESDVNLAKAGGAIIVGFHVRPAGKATKHAEQEGVQIRLYDIIYDCLDEVKSAMAGLLAPIKREVAMGKVEVRETFSIPKIGTIAGCMVLDGKITRKAHLRVFRNNVQVYEGKVGSLRRFKDDASEVQSGYECGMQVAGWNEITKGDVIECFEVVEEAAKL